MNEIINLLTETSPILIIVAVLAYFLKVYLGKRLEGLATRLNDIAKVSLDLKKEIRSEERGELVGFRVAVEKWEYFLQTELFDFTMVPPSEAKVSTFYERDRDLYLEVKIAIVKVCIYLRRQELEQQLMAAVEKIRKTYYPLIFGSLPRLIEIQAELLPLANKISRFEQSGFEDMAAGPTEKEREEHLRLQTMMTEEVEIFSKKVVREYRSIAEQMADLKEAINRYIYRPIEKAALDRD